MKKIKLFIAALVLASAVVAISINSRTSNDPFFKANLEALSDEESFSTEYVREEGTCSVYVGSKGYIQLGTGAKLTAGADGYITFDGRVVCSKEGNSSCRPIECVDLYTIILK